MYLVFGNLTEHKNSETTDANILEIIQNTKSLLSQKTIRKATRVRNTKHIFRDVHCTIEPFNL